MPFFAMPYQVLFHDTMAYGSQHHMVNIKLQNIARETILFASRVDGRTAMTAPLVVLAAFAVFAGAFNATALHKLKVPELMNEVLEPIFEKASRALAGRPDGDGLETLMMAPGLLAFLLVSEDEFAVDPEDAAKALPPESAGVLKAAAAALTRAEPWTHEAIEAALKHALLEEMGLKPRPAFAPVRVAVTGRRVAPPLYQSIELLGRDHAIRRLTNGIGLAIASG